MISTQQREALTYFHHQYYYSRRYWDPVIVLIHTKLQWQCEGTQTCPIIIIIIIIRMNPERSDGGDAGDDADDDDEEDVTRTSQRPAGS